MTTDKNQEARRRLIDEMKQKIDALTGGQDSTYISPSCPEGIAEKFLEQVLAFESEDERPLIDPLLAIGIALPAPEELADAQLGLKLQEVIGAMSHLGVYLENTNHLSDRELYEVLWKEILREATAIMPQNPECACQIDLVGSGSEEHTQVYLKYYADDDEREQWASDWPDDLIPDHQDPPYDRDRHLPRPPF